MPLLLLLLLLGAGCAAPGHELHRGTPTAPPPAPHRPGVGAPVVGQPGSHTEALPRSPHQRVLPPSVEPGLWAGDEPRASRKHESGKPELFGVLLPVLELGSTEKVEGGPAIACVALWKHALPGTGLAEKVSALRPGDRRCMVAHMFNACVRVIEELDEIMSEKGVVVLQARKHRAALRKAANDFFQVECGGARLSASKQRLLGDLQSALDDALHAPE